MPDPLISPAVPHAEPPVFFLTAYIVR